MQISLKSIIKEAFKEAYKQYNNIINEESSAVMADRLNATPEGRAQKAQADQIIDTLENQKPGWEKYQWDPSGTSSADNLSQRQWNYIVETLAEKAKSTKDPKFAKIFSNIYSILPQRKNDSNGNSINVNSPAYNYFLSVSELLRDVSFKSPDMAIEALENAWGRAFYTDEWYKLLDLYQTYSGEGTNFGRLLTNNIRRWTNDLLKSKKSKNDRGTNSLDAPSNITGKSTDVEGGIDALDMNDEFEDDSIQNTPGGFEDEENTEDNLETGLDAYSADANELDALSKSKKTAALKFLKFQKAIDKIMHSAKSLPLSTQQQQGIFAINQISNNFKTYDEIAAEFPDIFSQTDEQGNTVNAEVKNVQSRLKSILTKVAKPMLEPYGVTPDIFSDPQWQSKNNLPADIVDQIIKQFESTSKAGTSEKRQYTHAFREYAQNHLTPEEIAKKPSQGVYNKENRKTGSADAVKASVVNLNRNQKFEVLADSIMNEFGFPIAFDSIVWSDYWKAGKELQSLKGAKKEPAMPVEKDPEANLYPFQRESYEEFLAKNLDLVMERVYNRLSKLI